MRKVVFVYLLLCALAANALVQESPRTSVKKIVSYSNFGGGDIVIQLEKNGSQCSSGYWMKKTDSGFQANYLLLFSAFQSELDTVIIEGDSLRLWAGSAMGMYCHISNVQLSH